MKSELDQAIEIIESGQQGITYREALLAGKYYKFQGLDVKSNVETLIKSRVSEYNQTIYPRWLKRISDTCDEYPIKTSLNIPITQKEIDIFKGIENMNARRLLFAIWSLSKYGVLNSNSRGRVKEFKTVLIMASPKDIMALAKIPYGVRKYNLIFRELVSLGYVTPRIKKEDTINICDFIGDQVDLVPIDDDMIYYLYHLCGDTMVFKCEHCGKWKRKSSARATSQKYCTDCRKIVDRQKDLNKKHKKRGK